MEPSFRQRSASTTSLELEKVVVVVRGEKIISKTHLAWSLTHVVRPGNCVTLLALLPGEKKGNFLIFSSFSVDDFGISRCWVEIAGVIFGKSYPNGFVRSPSRVLKWYFSFITKCRKLVPKECRLPSELRWCQIQLAVQWRLKERTMEPTGSYWTNYQNKLDKQLTLLDSLGEKLINQSESRISSVKSTDNHTDEKTCRRQNDKNKVISPSSKTLLHKFVQNDHEVGRPVNPCHGKDYLRDFERWSSGCNEALKFVGCQADIDFCREVQVTDFRLARWHPDQWIAGSEERAIGTSISGYLPPEYLDGGRITQKVDVFAFGVVLKMLEGGDTSIPLSLDLNSVGKRSGHLRGLKTQTLPESRRRHSRRLSH
ncbi:hypothetical protein PTKIN_Ptkin13bG0000700 [Pterospermum kingtungense]